MANWLRKLFGKSQDVRRVSTDTSTGRVYSRLRNQALSMRRADFSIPAPPPEAPVWGALMESNYSYPDITLPAALTLLALLDGTSSVYFGGGGGVFGAGDYENVRKASAEFIRAANQSYRHLAPCESFPVPVAEQTIFYALTDSGVLTADGLDAALAKEQHPLSPLFRTGHTLLMRLFQVDQSVD